MTWSSLYFMKTLKPSVYVYMLYTVLRMFPMLYVVKRPFCILSFFFYTYPNIGHVITKFHKKHLNTLKFARTNNRRHKAYLRSLGLPDDNFWTQVADGDWWWLWLLWGCPRDDGSSLRSAAHRYSIFLVLPSAVFCYAWHIIASHDSGIRWRMAALYGALWRRPAEISRQHFCQLWGHRWRTEWANNALPHPAREHIC